MPSVTNLHHAPARVKIRGILGERNLAVSEGPRKAALRLPWAALLHRIALPMLLLALGAGCMGGDSAPIERSELKDVVLQPADLPRVFVQFDEGRQVRADQVLGAPGGPTRFGRQDGWQARYRRPGTRMTRGPLVVESKADIFETANGARDELDGDRSALLEGLRVSGEASGLGDESFVATGTQGSGAFAVRFYLVEWRYENAAASLLVNGFEGKLTRQQVVELARKQQWRMEEAAA
jgi:hypothetical protein